MATEEMTPEELIRKNFDYLVKSKYLQKGSAEKAIGVCAGYFARSKKNQGISLNTAHNISQVFGISLDDLCSVDFHKKMRAEQIDKEIERLKKEKEDL